MLIRNAERTVQDLPTEVSALMTQGVELTRLPGVSENLASRIAEVELFFKWIKQHLRIKAIYGITENAVKTQTWIAITVYILAAIVRKHLNIEASLYTILQISSLAFSRKHRLIKHLKIRGPQWVRRKSITS